MQHEPLIQGLVVVGVGDSPRVAAASPPMSRSAERAYGCWFTPQATDLYPLQSIDPQQLMMWTVAPNSGVGMAARADRIRDVLGALKSGKSFERVPGPFLGVQADNSKAFGDNVVVGGVAPGSPAEKAGLKRGDVLLELDGAEVTSWNALTGRIAACKAGQVVEFRVQRKGGGPRLVVAGRDLETPADLKRLRQSLKPGERFEGLLSTDESRIIQVTLGENK